MGGRRMVSRYCTALLGAASIFAFGDLRPVMAQPAQAEASSGAGLEEIVVTARRREEKAQTVPIAITTFTPEALQQQNIRTATDINKDVTSIQLCCNRGALSFAWIRGVIGVLGYFDQLPVSLAGSASYFDLANIQVLKGPQGTLFGLSTNGGAILFESKRPVNDFEGYVSAEVGNYGHTNLQGVINVPVIEDKLLVRVGVQKVDTDGYVHDFSQNKDLYDEHYWVGRVSATMRPTDDFQNDIVVNYYSSHNNGTAFVWTLVNPTGLAAAIFKNAPFVGLNGQTQTGFINAFNQQLSLGKYGILGTDATGGTNSRVQQWNIVDTASWDITDNLTIKNIAGYQEIVQSGWTDTDGTPFPILDGKTQLANGTILPHQQPTPNVQYTEELQLLGKAFDRLTYTIGTFNQFAAPWSFASGTVNGRSPSHPGYSSTLGGVNGSLAYGTARSNAVYAQGTFDLSDFVEGLSFTGGYRYSWDKRHFRQDSYNSSQVLTKSVGVTGLFHAPTYTLSLDYQFTPTTMFYITDSKGYSSGGFNPNAPVGFQTFQPESLDNVEIGVKSDWSFMGVKARTNLSAFYGFYDNVQTNVTTAVPNPNGGPPLLQVLTQNSASAHIQGIEAQVTIIPVDSVELMVNAAYDYNKYDEFKGLSSAGKPIDLSNTPFNENPRWMFNIHGTYHLPVDPAYGNVSVSAVWSYQTSQINTSALPVLPVYITPGFDNLDLALDWHDIWGKPGVDFQVYGTNVLGNVMTNGPFGVYTALGIFGIAPKAPPMWGASLRYSF